jgi:hypothetical protein
MLRDQTGKIIIEKLNVFEIIIHQILVENNINTQWECIYEHVRLFTNAGNPIIAFNYCSYGKLVCYETTAETDMTLTILKDDHFYVQKQRNIINQFNAYHNCLGFCVLDGQFWINLTSENLNQILVEDNYLEAHDLNQDYFVVYYQDDSPVHISKYVHAQNQFQHKIGCNSHYVTSTDDVRNIYKYNRIHRLIQTLQN